MKPALVKKAADAVTSVVAAVAVAAPSAATKRSLHSKPRLSRSEI
jgi:hypothetical protein